MFVYQTSIHTMTERTPFEMMYGRDPKIPADIIFGQEEEHEMVLDYADYVVELKRRLSDIYEYVRAKHGQKVEKMKFNHDRNVRRNEYKVIDRVWLLRGDTKKGTSKKLSTRWKGPYRVLERMDERNYKIKI